MKNNPFFLLHEIFISAIVKNISFEDDRSHMKFIQIQIDMKFIQIQIVNQKISKFT